MHPIRFLCSLVATGALAACGGAPAEDVSYQVLFNEFSSRTFPESTYVLRSQGELDATWATGTAWTGFGVPVPAASAPTIDFTTYSMAGISLGLGLRCYIPQIVSVMRTDDTLTVAWRTNRDSQVTTSACNYDFPLNTFLTVPRWTGTVTFDHQM